MKPAALVLAAFASFPGAGRDLYPSGVWQGVPVWPAAGVTWSDTWILVDPFRKDLATSLGDPVLEPETSASDELLDDLPPPDDSPFRLTIVGCELALGSELTPDAWSRELWLGAPLPRPVESAHTDRDGRYVTYEQIPRRPGRPDDYHAYRYPLPDAQVVSGYDLDKPDAEQRRGHMNAVGHGGVDIIDKMGAPIAAVKLDHQLGDAEVLYVGPLYGETVVTRHVIREGGTKRDYLLVFGHLDRAADDLRRGVRLREGAILGYVGNSGSPELVHLHLEARRMRDGFDAWKLPVDLLNVREYSVVTDPRNVLPLRTPPRRVPRCTPKIAPPVRHYWLGDVMTLALDEP